MDMANIAQRVVILVFLFFLLSPYLLEAMPINSGVTPPESLWTHLVWHILGIVAGALALPSMLRALAAMQPPLRKWLYLVALFFFCAAGTLIFFMMIEIAASSLTPASIFQSFLRGALLPLGLLLFFDRFASTRHGLMMGLVFAATEIIWLAPGVYLKMNEGIAGVDLLATAGSYMQCIRIFVHLGTLWAAFLAVTLWAITPACRHESGKVSMTEVPDSPRYREAFSPGVVLAILLCWYGMSALLNNSLGYVVRFSGVTANTHIILAAVFIVIGICIDKAGALSMRAIIAACCFSFLVFPILPQLSGTQLFDVVYTVEHIVSTTFFFAMAILMGRSPYEGSFPGMMCTGIYLMFLISFFAFPATSVGTALTLLGGTVVSAIMVSLLYFPARKKNAVEDAVSAAPIQRQEESIMPLTQISFEEFVFRYKITQRKRELLVLLLQGNTTRKIAESMGITQYTVRLHIHEILKATGFKNRKELIDRIKYK